MKVHHLKTWPQFFTAVEANLKPFEIRRNDRPEKFEVGDHLALEEFIPCEDCKGTGSYVGAKARYGGSNRCACMDTQFPKGRLTGRMVMREVTFILSRGFGLQDGFCCMGIKPVDSEGFSVETEPRHPKGGKTSQNAPERKETAFGPLS